MTKKLLILAVALFAFCMPSSADAAVPGLRYMTVGVALPEWTGSCGWNCNTYSAVVNPEYFFNTVSPSGMYWVLFGAPSEYQTNAAQKVSASIVQQATQYRAGTGAFSAAQAEAAVTAALAAGQLTTPSNYSTTPLNYVLSVGAVVDSTGGLDQTRVTLRWYYAPGMVATLSRDTGNGAAYPSIAQGGRGEMNPLYAFRESIEDIFFSKAEAQSCGTSMPWSCGCDGCTVPIGSSNPWGTYHLFAATVATPTATLAANPTTVAQGDSSLLTWSSTGATACTGTNFDTGGLTSGSLSVAPWATTAYSVTCTGAGGTSAPANATVTVTPLGTPAGLSASCNTDGTQATLSWGAGSGASYYYVRVTPTNGGSCPAGWQIPAWGPTTCIPNPDSVGGLSTTFGTIVDQAYSFWVYAAHNGQYGTPGSGNFTCNNSAPQCSNGSDDDGDGMNDYPADPGCTSAGDTTEAPNPPPPPAAPTASLSCTPSSCTAPTGTPVTLTYGCTNSTSATLSTFGSLSPVSGGTRNATLAGGYELMCTGPGGSAPQSVSVSFTVPTVSITATPDRVDSTPPGGTSSIVWISSADITDCAITRNGAAFASGANSAGTPASNITTQTVFAASCTSGGVAGAATGQAIVNVLPRFEEF